MRRYIVSIFLDDGSQVRISTSTPPDIRKAKLELAKISRLASSDVGKGEEEDPNYIILTVWLLVNRVGDTWEREEYIARLAVDDVPDGLKEMWQLKLKKLQSRVSGESTAR